MSMHCSNMLMLPLRAAVVVAFAASAPAVAQTSAPDSPAAKQFAAWLTAFNKGDRAALIAYHQQSFPYAVASHGIANIDREVGLSGGTGGFDIMKSEVASPNRYSVVLKERNSRQFAHATMEVEASAPHRVVSFDIHPIETPDEFLTPEERRSGGGAIDGARRRTLLDKIERELDTEYVLPDVARGMVATLRENAAHGAYEKISDGGVFADTLTQDLQRVSHDQHVMVIHRTPRGPRPQSSKPEPPDMNCGFGTTEWLKGNVARVIIEGFCKIDDVREGVADVMSKVADANALILDLRGNTGGDAATVDLVASYLFDDTPVRLRDMVRRDGSVTSAWTNRHVKDKRFGSRKPIYVLIDSHTMSGGESLAFSLQGLHRATLVGEKTAGAANIAREYKLDDWFLMFFSVVRVIDPITKSTWEGVGVRPDVAVTGSAALDEALRRVAQGNTRD